MGRRKPKYIITLQISNGTGPKISYEINDGKAQTIIDLIQNDIDKSIKKRKCSSITLDMFFQDRDE